MTERSDRPVRFADVSPASANSERSDRQKNGALGRRSESATVAAVVASTTVAYALSKGMTIEEVQSLTGVSGLDLVNPEARVPDDVVARLWAGSWRDSRTMRSPWSWREQHP